MDFILPLSDKSILLENIEADDIDSLINTFGTTNIEEIKSHIISGSYLHHENKIIGYTHMKFDNIPYSPLKLYVSLDSKPIHICLYIFRKYRKNNYEKMYINKIITYYFNQKIKYIYVGISKYAENAYIYSLTIKPIKILNKDHIDNHYIFINPIFQNDKRIMRKIKEIEDIVENNLTIET